MPEKRRLTDAEVAERRQLRLEAMNLQVIAGNPLDAEDIAMFEMFERERWNEEECLAFWTWPESSPPAAVDAPKRRLYKPAQPAARVSPPPVF